jgi:hypothetical protein
VVVAQVEPDYFKNVPAAEQRQVAEEKTGEPEQTK